MIALHSGQMLELAQESRAHADYGALLQDARLLRRDIAQAIEDREIQKVELNVFISTGTSARSHSRMVQPEEIN